MSTQLIVNAINSTLNNYNSTLSLKKPSYIRQGDSEKGGRFDTRYAKWRCWCFSNL